MKIAYSKNGFTLVEVLVVTALTVLIMSMVFIPLYDGVGLTRTSQVMIRTQDNARQIMSLINRDLSEALFVFVSDDNRMKFKVVDEKGLPVEVYAPFARIDMVLPRMMGYCTSGSHPAGKTREFPRSFIVNSSGDAEAIANNVYDEAAPRCPYDGSLLELRPVQPLTPETRVVRYFVGLRDPSQDYANRYLKTADGGKVPSETGLDNMYVLYRAEFTVNDPDLIAEADWPAQVDMSNPDFFYDTRPSHGGTVNGTGSTVSDGWRKISSIVVTGMGGTDLINVDYSTSSLVQVFPTVTFSPTPIYNDPLAPVNDSNSSPESGDAPPVAYKATYGHWTLPYEVKLRRKEPLDPTATVYWTENDGGHMWIKRAAVVPTDPDVNVFDITQYEIDRDASASGAGIVVSDTPPELAFSVDVDKGLVNCAFKHVEDAGTATAGSGDSLTDTAKNWDVDRWANGLLTITDGMGKGQMRRISSNTNSTITVANNWTVDPDATSRYEVSLSILTDDVNKFYNNAPPEDRYRMWELHHPQQRDVLYEDLGNAYENDPIPASRVLDNSTVVPGMERVYGPYAVDSGTATSSFPLQYGSLMLYGRVPFWDPASEPGLNQYKLDIDHPVRDGAGALVLDIDGNPLKGVAAIYFYSAQSEYGSGSPLPSGESIYVSYYEQNNKKGDTLTGNYSTKEIITVLLGIRIYDSTSGKVQTVQLTNKIRIKNVRE